eukprot:2888249-Pleurochrysis_carterae.AAC.9
MAINPQLNSQSCFALRLLALGVRHKDDRHGARQLLASNLDFIDHLILNNVVYVEPQGETHDEDGQLILISLPAVPVYFSLYFVGDFAGVRAIEGAICGCSPDSSHAGPTIESVSMYDNLTALVRRCDCRLTTAERTAWAHEPVGGIIVPCSCCDYRHRPERRQAERDAFQGELKALQKDKTEVDKKALASYISKHKRNPKGTLPGPDGTPFTSATLDRWIVDLLHVDLNESKLAWKSA